MTNHRTGQSRSARRAHLWFRLVKRSQTRGQAIIEYVLILALVTIALIAVLTITGPAVGNVFSNAVYNLLGGTIEPRDTLSADQFWEQVAAVASYTPENPRLTTNTPAPETATPTTGPSPTPTDVTPSPTPTNTNTPGPSPTPPDQNFGYPFEDKGEHPDWWEHDFDGLLGPWNAEFWNMCNTDSCSSYDSSMSTGKYNPGKGDWQTTFETLDHYWSDSPGGGVDRNFYARFTNSANLEAKQYTLRFRKDDGMRIWIGGVAIYDSWSWNPDRDNWITRTFTPTAGQNDIIVEMFDNGWGARASVILLDEVSMLDEGDCNWAISDEAYRSAPTAWSDSPGASYAPNSYCILALRGYIDLRGSSNPKLEFWDRFNLNSGTYARVGLSVAGTDNWTDYNLHYNETDLGWTRQTFDLSNFADPDGPGPNLGRDFSNEIIEIRFILHATSWSTADGWWIDDISVKEEVIKRYTVGFADDMEGASHWYPGGTWARSNEEVHSGSLAWSDSPGASYQHGSNNTLELDGVIVLDNDQLDGNPVIDPEVVFWHRYELGYNDAIYIEVSTNNRYTWQPLTGNYLTVNTTNTSWTQVVLSLADYAGSVIHLRFRLDARSHTQVDNGWWIDDFSLRNKPDAVITPNWCDNMETGGSDWIAGGTWAIVNGPDYNPSQPYNQTITAHSGSQFWSDSPGQNYAHETNSSLQLSARLDLTGSSNPEMAFWHQWDVGYADDLYVEVSTDDGTSWTTIWTYQYNNLPAGYRLVVDHRYNTNLSWTRESVSLRNYVGQVIRVRFRLDALYNSATEDGWWVDDVCFQEFNEPVRTLPFSDGFERGDNNWYAGGTWTIAPENKHDGAVAYTDSYGVQYKHGSNAILELRGAVDLTGTVKPTLYFWEAFDLAYEDYALVEINVSDDNGMTWRGWDEVFRHRYETTSSWDRRQVGQADMSDYIGKWIRIRFRLYAVRGTQVADGWWIDDVSIVDRDGIEPTFPLPFNEDVESDNDYWVMDGTWARMSMFRTVGSGSALGPGGWTAEYFNDLNHNRAFDAGELVTTRQDAQIDFDWGSGGPAELPGVYDYFLVRWTRTIQVANDDTQYQIQTQSDDGIRVRVDGATVINRWVDRGFPSSPDVADVTLNEGPHTIVVEYYERGGNARVLVNFGITGRVFTDSPSGNYFHMNDMSLTLEGLIDLTGTANPALTYWDRRSLGWSDTVYTEISTDEGFTWRPPVRSATGTDNTWRERHIDLSAFAGQKINIRFRLDGRGGSSSSTGDGWYIDDIRVAE